MIEVANETRSDLLTVRSQLCHLQEVDENVSIAYQDPAFHVQTLGNFSIEDQDYICRYLCDKMKEQEMSHLEKLHIIHAALCSQLPSNPFEPENCATNMDDGQAVKKKPSLLEMSDQYFSEEGLNMGNVAKFNLHVLPLVEEVTPEQESSIRITIQSLIVTYDKQNFTGSSIARIFHGISSPCFSATVWGSRNTFWRRYIAIDFNTLCEIATKVLCEQ